MQFMVMLIQFSVSYLTYDILKCTFFTVAHKRALQKLFSCDLLDGSVKKDIDIIFYLLCRKSPVITGVKGCRCPASS